MQFSQKTTQIIQDAEKKCKKQFKLIEENAFFNQQKVLSAFQNNAVQARHFFGTTGYGYDDIGRDTLCKVFADIFHCESALVSPALLSGTHALTVMLFGLLRPNDTVMSISGEPYDTLHEVIRGKNCGSLADYNINFQKIELKNGKIDTKACLKAIKMYRPKVVTVQRSRGYEWRDSLSIEQLANTISAIKTHFPDVIVAVDNCYGEFVEKLEPTDAGADVIVGSLIKNAGGGLAPTGAYIAGKTDCINQISYRFTSPSIGAEIGSSISGYLPYYQGVFLAPSTVASALKGSVLMGQVFSDLGYKTLPEPNKICADITRSVRFNTKDELISFIQSVQAASPVDSNVLPMPWDMPGYSDQVIMAAGAFIQGSSIELSADAPIREPYIAYIQGGLTYEHVKIATLYCVENLLKE